MCQLSQLFQCRQTLAYSHDTIYTPRFFAELVSQQQLIKKIVDVSLPHIDVDEIGLDGYVKIDQAVIAAQRSPKKIVSI